MAGEILIRDDHYSIYINYYVVLTIDSAYVKYKTQNKAMVKMPAICLLPLKTESLVVKMYGCRDACVPARRCVITERTDQSPVSIQM